MADAFRVSVIVIGITGAAANGLMFYALVQSKVRREGMSLVFNQMALDFGCGLMLILFYSLKFSALDYTGVAGAFLCKAIWSEAILWGFLNCSTANLVVLTLERYTKIVHSVFHRTHLRPWMYRVAIALTWLDFVAIVNVVVSSVTSVVESGKCQEFSRWQSQAHRAGFAIWSFLVTFVCPLVAFIYCYSRILQVAQKRTKTNPVNFNNLMKSVAQQNSIRTQMNIIKTFLIVSVCYVVCWSPNRLFFFLFNLKFLPDSYNSNARYCTVFVAFFNICLNPFIYAAKLDPVKKYLRMKLCKNEQSQKNDATNMGTVSVIRTSTVMQPIDIA